MSPEYELVKTQPKLPALFLAVALLSSILTMAPISLGKAARSFSSLDTTVSLSAALSAATRISPASKCIAPSSSMARKIPARLISTTRPKSRPDAVPPKDKSRPTSGYTSRTSSAPPTNASNTINDAKDYPPEKRSSATPQKPNVENLLGGLNDAPPARSSNTSEQVDWTSSYHGLSAEPFPKETADILLKPLDFDDVEIKPDGICYLPEIKYRRILNRAFGPGGWGLAPRGESTVTSKAVTREYALVALGRYGSLLENHMQLLVSVLYEYTSTNTNAFSASTDWSL